MAGKVEQKAKGMARHAKTKIALYDDFGGEIVVESVTRLGMPKLPFRTHAGRVTRGLRIRPRSNSQRDASRLK